MKLVKKSVQSPFLRFPLLSLLSIAAVLSICLIAMAFGFLKLRTVQHAKAATLQDIATVFSGTIGSGVALAGSIVAIYLALTSLRSVRRQEVTDSQAFIDSYIADVYPVFVSLSHAVDALISTVIKGMTSTPMLQMMERLMLARKRNDVATRNAAIAEVIDAVDEDALQNVLIEIQAAYKHLADAIGHLSLSHRASSVFRYTSSLHKRTGEPLPYVEAEGVHADSSWHLFDRFAKQGHVTQGSLLFFRSMEVGLSNLLTRAQDDLKTRRVLLLAVKACLLNTLQFGSIVDTLAFEGKNGHIRTEWTWIGYCCYLGDMSGPYLDSGSNSKSTEANVSLIFIAELLRGIPTQSALTQYFEHHFFESLIRESDGVNIFRQHLSSLDDIGTTFPRLRTYLQELRSDDILFAETFSSAIRKKIHKNGDPATMYEARL